MSYGEKTKLLWQNPEYRKHMSEVHMGHKKPENAYSFPKGKDNPNQRPEVRKKISNSKFGDKNGMWNGGVTMTNCGYRKIKENESNMADGKGYVLEHRKVMSEYLGRELTKLEVVHHIDCNRKNNNIDNLMLFNNVGEHTAYHHKMKGKVVIV